MNIDFEQFVAMARGETGDAPFTDKEKVEIMDVMPEMAIMALQIKEGVSSSDEKFSRAEVAAGMIIMAMRLEHLADSLLP